MYGKMLKKVFGAATVCVAFGATELKADFEEDLKRVCNYFEIKDIKKVKDKFLPLFDDFKKSVRDAIWETKNNPKLESEGKIESILKFLKKLESDSSGKIKGEEAKKTGELIKEAKENAMSNEISKTSCFPMRRAIDALLFAVEVSEASEGSFDEKRLKKGNDLLYACQFVFLRRICGLIDVSVRELAGSFDLSQLSGEFEKLQNEQKTFGSWKVLPISDLKNTFFLDPSKFNGRLSEKKSSEDSTWRKLCRAQRSLLFRQNVFNKGLLGYVKSKLDLISSEEIWEEGFFEFFKKYSNEDLVERRKEVKASDKLLKSDSEYRPLFEAKENAVEKLNAMVKDYEKRSRFIEEKRYQAVALDKQLLEIGRNIGKGEVSWKEYEEMKKCIEKIDPEMNGCYEELEILRGKISKQRKEVFTCISEIKDWYLKKGESSDSEKERKFLKNAIGLRQIEIFLKTFFCGNAFMREKLQIFVSSLLNDVKKVKTKENGDVKFELTDDFEKEYKALVKDM